MSVNKKGFASGWVRRTATSERERICDNSCELRLSLSLGGGAGRPRPNYFLLAACTAVVLPLKLVATYGTRATFTTANYHQLPFTTARYHRNNYRDNYAPRSNCQWFRNPPARSLPLTPLSKATQLTSAECMMPGWLAGWLSEGGRCWLAGWLAACLTGSGWPPAWQWLAGCWLPACC
jgi:hypothetical protein